MIGLVLAAGAGSRLAPLTDDLPKTLLPVLGERSILELTLGNLASAGIERVVVVVGFAAGQIRDRVPDLQARCGVEVELVVNDRAQTWNNAYSLWCAREHLLAGPVLARGAPLDWAAGLGSLALVLLAPRLAGGARGWGALPAWLGVAAMALLVAFLLRGR